MCRQLTSVLSLIGLLCGTAWAAEPDRLAPAFARIDAYVERSMREEGTPGAVVALTSREGSLGQRAYGFADLESRIPVTAETLFQIGSISKSFTAIALLQLVDEGRLRLDAPVTAYLPWFSVRSDFAPITVHHLLTHTAGIPSNRDDLPASPFMALALREQAAAWPPGERFRYSNVGYQVLHVLLETVAGKSWAEVVGERILAPLAMNGSEPAITHAMRSRQAVGYVPPYDDRPHHPSRPLVRAPFFEYSVGDGCVAATGSDMAKYVRMLLDRGRGPSGPILSESSFRAFSTPWIRFGRKSAYGYGIVVRDDPSLRLLHGGGMVGASAMIIADVEAGLGVAVMLNGPGDPQDLATFALEAVRSALAGEALPSLPEDRGRGWVEEAGDYGGTFASPAGPALVFVAGDHRLSLLDHGRTIDLESHGNDVFYTPDPAFDGYYFRFGRNEEGEVVEVTHGPRWFANDRHQGPAELPSPAGWSVYTGRYVSPSPWFPSFTVFVRRGALWAVTGGGGESEAGEELLLVPLGGGVFRPGEAASPEIVRFDDVVEGKAWSATWSGHRFYRDRAQRPPGSWTEKVLGAES